MAVIDEKLSFTRRDVDGNEIRFYPETKTKFVTDDNGKSIAELLNGGGGTLKKSHLSAATSCTGHMQMLDNTDNLLRCYLGL